MSAILGLFEFDAVWFSVNYWYALVLPVCIGFLVDPDYRATAPFGRALIGIRENVDRMHAIGSPVFKTANWSPT